MSENSLKYRFGEFVLDPGSRRISRNGVPVEVQNQVFDLLHFLVRNPRVVVSKDLLLKDVWKNQHLTEATITQAVRKARSAIGDDGSSQKVIRTVYGKGFLFESDVVAESTDTGGVGAGDTQSDSKRATPARSFRTMAVAGFVVAIVLTATIFALRFPNAPAAPVRGELATVIVLPFSNETGDSAFDWVEYGLPETLRVLFENSDDIAIQVPENEGPFDGDLGVVAALFGAHYGLQASVTRSSDRLAVDWSLGRPGEGRVSSGQLVALDSSVLSRNLAEAIHAQIRGTPVAPVGDIPLLNDPLSTELFARAMQASYRDDLNDAQAFLRAALVRLPDDMTLKTELAIASFDFSSIDASIERYHTALDALPTAAKAQRNKLKYEIGTQLWFAGDRQRAATFLAEIVETTDPDELLHAKALNSLSFVRQSERKFEQAWEYAKQAEVLLREQNNPYYLSMAFNNQGYLAEDSGRIVEAGDHHRRALEIRRQYGFPTLIAASQYGLGRIARRRGDFVLADELLEQALATMRAYARNYDEFDILEELAELRMRQGRFDESQRLLEQARALAIEYGDDLGIAWADQVQVRLWLRTGDDSSTALSTIQSAYESLQEMGETTDAFIARLEWAQVLFLESRHAEAERLLDDIEQDDAMRNRWLRLMHQRTRASGNVLSEPAAAIALYHDVLVGAREIGVKDMEADVAIDIGLLAADSGNQDRARRMLAIANAWSADYYRTQELARRVDDLVAEAVL